MVSDSTGYRDRWTQPYMVGATARGDPCGRPAGGLLRIALASYLVERVYRH